MPEQKPAQPNAADLPPISDAEADAVVEWLLSKEKTQRRPTATARLLVLVVKLHLARTPWPTRGAVAEHLGVSLPLVDVAISQRRAQGYIKVVIETTQGHVRQRKSVVTHRFIEPCGELCEIVRQVMPRPRARKRQPKTPVE